MISESVGPAETRIRPTDGEPDPQPFGGAHTNSTRKDAVPPAWPRTYYAIIKSVADKYLADLDPDEPPHPWQLEADLLNRTNKELRIENVGRVEAVGKQADANSKNQLQLLRTLLPEQVALILARLHRVVRLIPSHDEDAIPGDNDPLLIYRPQNGIYVRSNDAISAASAKYSNGGTQFQRDMIAALRIHAPHLRLGTDREWAAVGNGDYHRATKELHPFSPERVFLSRVPVAYIAGAKNPTIHNDEDGTDWDVDSGLLEIASGNLGTQRLIWELFAAVLQPNVRTNKAVALHNPVGNNGKGTILELLRRLAGEANTLSASVVKLAQDTTLPLLSGKSLVVSDENATNDFVKNAETIKMLATREPYFVNPKYHQPYNETFEGTQVHCMNALPRFGDHTDSMWRRWLFIPLTAEFQGRDRKYIKDDYIKRPEVLQYILRTALEMTFTGFTETAETRKLMSEAKVHNDPARQFWEEFEPEFKWDLLPLEFLYELFKAWFARNKPGGKVVDRSTFDESLRSAVSDKAAGWVALEKRDPKKASVHMKWAEPLIKEYGLNPKWDKTDPKKQFRGGLFRDRVALVLTSAATIAASASAAGAQTPLTAVAAPEPRDDLQKIERLIAEDVATWEVRAVEDDKLTDWTHLHDHAAMRRMGYACGGCKIKPQRRYDEALIRHSRDLDVALFAAQASMENDQAA